MHTVHTRTHAYTNKENIYIHVYTRTHTHASTQYLSRPSTRSQDSLSTSFHSNPFMSFEVPPPRLSLFAHLLPSFTCLFFPLPSISLSCFLDFYSLLIQFCFLTPTLCDSRLSSYNYIFFYVFLGTHLVPQYLFCVNWDCDVTMCHHHISSHCWR